MSLKNLLGISLDEVRVDKAHVAKLIAAAERNIADAQLQGLSNENRFDATDMDIIRARLKVAEARAKELRDEVTRR